MNKLLVICGPTAVGKTALGIKLAKKFAGELVSADSRQVYKGMDIGTGKDLPPNSRFTPINQALKTPARGKNYCLGYYLFDSIPVWLLDVVKPNYWFTAADYLHCTRLALKNILKRKKLPILVGGTGLYIKALVEGIDAIGIPPNWELRKKLENKDLKTLQEQFKTLNPQGWKKMTPSDRKNQRRLIRAIEIAQSQTPKTINRQPSTANHLGIVLTAPYQILYPRIDSRVEKRVNQGVVTEIEELLKKGFSWNNSALGKTIGYQEFQPLFEEKESLAEVVQKWKYAEHAYARRQKTWFKKAFSSQSAWFDISQKGVGKKIEAKVKDWLKAA